MPKKSAGLLLYRLHNSTLQVLLVHPGGPFWVKKDIGAWSIPKGEFSNEEDAWDAANREAEEELGLRVTGEFFALTSVKQKSGKLIYAWAMRTDLDAQKIKSNTFEMEWPPSSGKQIMVPEVDKAEWFGIEEAKRKINAGQVPFINELVKLLE